MLNSSASALARDDETV